MIFEADEGNILALYKLKQDGIQQPRSISISSKIPHNINSLCIRQMETGPQCITTIIHLTRWR